MSRLVDEHWNIVNTVGKFRHCSSLDHKLEYRDYCYSEGGTCDCLHYEGDYGQSGDIEYIREACLEAAKLLMILGDEFCRIDNKQTNFGIAKDSLSSIFDITRLIFDNESIMLELLSMNEASFLQSASSRLKNDQDFAKKALELKKYGATPPEDCLGKFSLGIRGNEKFVLEAIKNSPKCFIHASSELKNDLAFIKKAVGVNRDCFDTLPLEIQNRSDIFTLTLKGDCNEPDVNCWRIATISSLDLSRIDPNLLSDSESAFLYHAYVKLRDLSVFSQAQLKKCFYGEKVPSKAIEEFAKSEINKLDTGYQYDQKTGIYKRKK